MQFIHKELHDFSNLYGQKSGEYMWEGMFFSHSESPRQMEDSSHHLWLVVRIFLFGSPE